MAMGDKGATLDGLKASHDNLDGKITDLKSDLKSAIDKQDDDFIQALHNISITNNITGWSNGWIRDDGLLGGATKHCISGFKNFTRANFVKLSVLSGYKIAKLGRYSSNSENSFVGLEYKNITKTAVINVTSGYFVIDIQKTDETALPYADLPSNVVTFTYVTELECRNLWQSGIYSYDGTATADQTRAATADYVPDWIKKIKAKDGYTFKVYAYNNDNSYVGVLTQSGLFYNSSGHSSMAELSYVDFTSYGYAKYKISVKKTSNANISFIEAETSYNYVAIDENELPSYAFREGYLSGDGGYVSSAKRISTIGYIDENVKQITAKKGFHFRVAAFNSSDDSCVGVYRTSDSFETSGTSKELKYFDFSKYAENSYRYKITVIKDSEADILPPEGNGAFYQIALAGEEAQRISDIEKTELCLVGMQTTMPTEKMPYHKGFLFYRFTQGSTKGLFFGTRLDNAKPIAECRVDIHAANAAVSPSDGTVILATSNYLYVLRNGTTYGVKQINDPWLYNSGVDFIKDENETEYCIYGEYGANPGGEMCVWRGVHPYTAADNWEKVMTVIGETDIHHFHQVRRDPWTNILYLTCGDENSLTHWWYSEDCGATWTKLVDGVNMVSTWGTMACRTINFIFTKDYIYWATDSYQNHMLCRIQRNSETGIIDISTFEKIATLKAGCATNSICYSEAPHGIFMYERVDSGATDYYGTPVTMQFYDLDSNELKDVVTLGLTGETWGGNRGKCYVNYTNITQPYPAMGFAAETPCIFDVISDDAAKTGTIVYDIMGKTVRNVILDT